MTNTSNGHSPNSIDQSLSATDAASVRLRAAEVVRLARLTPAECAAEIPPVAVCLGLDAERLKGMVAAATCEAVAPAVPARDVLTLSPYSPLESARKLMKRRYLHGSMPTLHHQGGVFYRWSGTRYIEVADEEIRSVICQLLDGAKSIFKKQLVDFNPTPGRVGDVAGMLRNETQLPAAIRAPAWLDDLPHPPAGEIFSCVNGLLHLATGELHPHSPAFFSCNSVDYSFNPSAPPPGEWLAFLRSIWPNDQEAIDTLQEIFGYLLTGDTAQQKVFLIVGPPRSGKGTIGRVLTELLGKANVVGPTLASLSTGFGLAPLIGKPLAIISDARLGGRADLQLLVERILSISGEDTLTIDRKYREPYTGRLPTRFLILTNELPRLPDASGAVPSRVVLIRLQQDFRGREDHGLTARLVAELPAILNWAIAGRARLAARGRFVQPESSLQAMETLEDLASPISAFLRDRVVIGAGGSVECNRLFAEWLEWCRQQGRDHPGTLQTFGRDLHAALPSLQVSRRLRAGGGERTRYYEGITLIAPTDETDELAIRRLLD